MFRTCLPIVMLFLQAQAQPRDISVCEAIRDRDSLDGKVVSIRGIVERSAKLFVLLPEAKCAEVRAGVVPAVWVQLREENRSPSLARIERLLAAAPDHRVAATVQGRFASAREYMVTRAGSGSAGTGFGYLGLYPAQLEFQLATPSLRSRTNPATDIHVRESPDGSTAVFVRRAEVGESAIWGELCLVTTGVDCGRHPLPAPFEGLRQFSAPEFRDADTVVFAARAADTWNVVGEMDLRTRRTKIVAERVVWFQVIETGELQGCLVVRKRVARVGEPGYDYPFFLLSRENAELARYEAFDLLRARIEGAGGKISSPVR